MGSLRRVQTETRLLPGVPFGLLGPDTWARFFRGPQEECPLLQIWLLLKNQYQNETLVSGNMNQNLRNPSWLILSHTHILPFLLLVVAVLLFLCLLSFFPEGGGGSCRHVLLRELLCHGTSHAEHRTPAKAPRSRGTLPILSRDPGLSRKPPKTLGKLKRTMAEHNNGESTPRRGSFYLKASLSYIAQELKWTDFSTSRFQVVFRLRQAALSTLAQR